VTVIVTGNELVAPGQVCPEGKIYDSNTYSIAAACAELGITDCRCFRLGDERAAMLEHLARALEESDVVLTVGGISVGDYDLVRDILGQLGVEEIFWRVAIKPGKPFYAGVKRTALDSGGKEGQVKPVFGLTGNPVSALVCFHQLVKPSLLKMMGLSSSTRIILQAILSAGLKKETERLEWVRGVFYHESGSLRVHPTTGRESHMLGSLTSANCLIEFPAGKTTLHPGDRVNVELLNWHG